jgi:hypothetical protein
MAEKWSLFWMLGQCTTPYLNALPSGCRRSNRLTTPKPLVVTCCCRRLECLPKHAGYGKGSLRDPPNRGLDAPNRDVGRIALVTEIVAHALGPGDVLLLAMTVARLPRRAHHPGQHAFLGMQPVLRLVEHHRVRAVDHAGIHFLAAMSGQAVHE